MSFFNDTDWTKNGVFFEFSNGKRLRKEISIGTLVFSVLEMKKNGMELTITSLLKDNGILPQMPWYPISKIADIQWREMYDSLQW